MSYTAKQISESTHEGQILQDAKILVKQGYGSAIYKRISYHINENSLWEYTDTGALITVTKDGRINISH